MKSCSKSASIWLGCLTMIFLPACTSSAPPNRADSGNHDAAKDHNVAFEAGEDAIRSDGKEEQQNEVKFVKITTPIKNLRDGVAQWWDYDGDGDLDVFVCGLLDLETPISKLYNNSGKDTFVETQHAFVGLRFCSVAFGDCDGDGDEDLIITGNDKSLQPRTILYLSVGGDFQEHPITNIQNVATGVLAWGNLDNDADLDLLLSGRTANYDVVTKLYKNTGNNTFTEVNTEFSSGNPLFRPSTFNWYDLDQDNDLDFVVTAFPTTPQIFLNNGNDSFTKSEIFKNSVYYGSIDINDYNLDNHPDILLTGEVGGGATIATVLKNDGSTSFVEQKMFGLTGIAHGTAKWGDYDNDGDLDILSIGRIGVTPNDPKPPIYHYEIKVYQYYNSAYHSVSTKFTGLIDSVSYYDNVSGLWGDYDKDGDLDVLLKSIDGSQPITEIYRNDLQ